MKTKTTIQEISHDELVDLLCTATYCSNCFYIVPKDMHDYYGTPIQSDEDSREDVWAKLLLNGKGIVVCDRQAHDEGEFYGGHVHHYNDFNNCMEYTITLKDIIKGLENAANGTFKIQGPDDVSLARNCFCSFDGINDSDFDLECAETLLQVIVYNEIIYG